VEIDASKKTVTTPRLPLSDYTSWRTEIVGSVKQPSAGVVDCLRALAPYLSRPQKSALLGLLADPQHINAKYRNLNFKCRVLQQLGAVEEEHKIN